MQSHKIIDGKNGEHQVLSDGTRTSGVIVQPIV